jgi:hypothetical protein
VYTLAESTSRSPAVVADEKDPLSEVDVVVSVAEAACTKAGADTLTGLTVREKVVAWVAETPVPVTVMVEVPIGVDVEVVTDMVELCPALSTCGLNDTRAPDGAPVALSDTDWLEPLVTVVEIVLVVPDPAVTVAEAGLAETEKSLLATAGFTVNVKFWLAGVPTPLFAVMVMG